MDEAENPPGLLMYKDGMWARGAQHDPRPNCLRMIGGRNQQPWLAAVLSSEWTGAGKHAAGFEE